MVPPTSTSAERISIRRLLNHSAGLPDYGPIRAYHEAVRSSPTEPWSFDRFAAETFEKGLLFRPGRAGHTPTPAYMLDKEDRRGGNRPLLPRPRSGVPRPPPRDWREPSLPESLEDLAPLAPGISALLSVDRFAARGATVLSSGVGVAWSRGIYRVRGRPLLGRAVSRRLLSRRMVDQMLELTSRDKRRTDASARIFHCVRGSRAMGSG